MLLAMSVNGIQFKLSIRSWNYCCIMSRTVIAAMREPDRPLIINYYSAAYVDKKCTTAITFIVIRSYKKGTDFVKHWRP